MKHRKKNRERHFLSQKHRHVRLRMRERTEREDMNISDQSTEERELYEQGNNIYK